MASSPFYNKRGRGRGREGQQRRISTTGTATGTATDVDVDLDDYDESDFDDDDNGHESANLKEYYNLNNNDISLGLQHLLAQHHHHQQQHQQQRDQEQKYLCERLISPVPIAPASIVPAPTPASASPTSTRTRVAVSAMPFGAALHSEVGDGARLFDGVDKAYDFEEDEEEDDYDEDSDELDFESDFESESDDVDDGDDDDERKDGRGADAQEEVKCSNDRGRCTCQRPERTRSQPIPIPYASAAHCQRHGALHATNYSCYGEEICNRTSNTNYINYGIEMNNGSNIAAHGTRALGFFPQGEYEEEERSRRGTMGGVGVHTLLHASLVPGRPQDARRRAVDFDERYFY